MATASAATRPRARRCRSRPCRAARGSRSSASRSARHERRRAGRGAAQRRPRLGTRPRRVGRVLHLARAGRRAAGVLALRARLMRVVATAGHVDHGKSTLIRALTGIDPDRLQEERERGMTIDLGFAWLRTPGGAEIGIVDVPGHQDFIRNMLAGVGAIDAVLLVVALDEGVMPQTREHLAILELLGTERGVVALTKRDLVDDEWAALAKADVVGALAGTPLAGAPLVEVSSTSRLGLDALVVELE